MKSNKVGISIFVVICLVLIAGMIYSNRASKNTAISDDIEDQDMDIEKEVGKPNIPEIKPNNNTKVEEDEDIKDEIEKENIENEEAIQENTEEDKNTVPTISKPKKQKLPEEMEKPITEPKPEEPPKSVNEEIKDKAKPPTIKQENKEEVKGGTGDDGVVRDLKGNPLKIEGNPNAKPNEVKGSDLLPDGKKAGEGDKF